MDRSILARLDLLHAGRRAAAVHRYTDQIPQELYPSNTGPEHAPRNRAADYWSGPFPHPSGPLAVLLRDDRPAGKSPGFLENWIVPPPVRKKSYALAFSTIS